MEMALRHKPKTRLSASQNQIISLARKETSKKKKKKKPASRVNTKIHVEVFLTMVKFSLPSFLWLFYSLCGTFTYTLAYCLGFKFMCLQTHVKNVLSAFVWAGEKSVQANLSYAIKRNTVAWVPGQFPINHRHLAHMSTKFFLLIRHVASFLCCRSPVAEMKTTQRAPRSGVCLEQLKIRGQKYPQV